MNIAAIDHVNLRIPQNGIETAIEFYETVLGCRTENLDRYEAKEKSFFSFRLNETNVIHVRPDDSFRESSGHSYDHLAVRVNDSVEELKRQFEDADIEIVKEIEPLGATGVAPAVYVRDPFGYLLELKETN